MPGTECLTQQPKSYSQTYHQDLHAACSTSILILLIIIVIITITIMIIIIVIIIIINDGRVCVNLHT